MDILRGRVRDLEAHVIKLKVDSVATSQNTKAIESLTDAVGDLKDNMGFVKNAKTVFNMILLSLILSASGVVWGMFKKDPGLTPKDIAAIVEAVKVTQAP